MPIFLFNFFPLTFYWRLATSQQSSCSCLLNQCTFTTYFLWEEDQINWSCTAEKIFNPFNLFTITQKQTFTFTNFEDGRHFKMAAMRRLPVFFYFLFFIDLFLEQKKTTQTLVFLNIHIRNIDMKYGIFIMPLHYFCLQTTDSEFHITKLCSVISFCTN